MRADLRGLGAPLGIGVAALLAAALAAGCPDSTSGEAENTPERCADSQDNDRDGYTDCADIQCAPYCRPADADADTDEDVEVDADGDGDADGDTDGDTDSDVDTDADADADEDADEDFDLDGPFPCERTEDCPVSGLLCYDYLLDDVSLCAPRGSACEVSADCEPRQSCTAVRGWIPGETYCTVPAGACGTSASCPDGFRCEDRVGCVDRRVPCVGDEDCPVWDRCGTLPSGLQACVAAPLEPCTGPADCPGGECVDVQGDGPTECQEAGGECMTNADCALGTVCGDQDGLPGAECGRVGPCLYAGNCPAGWECLDVNGDGQEECQAGGGSCLVDADCSVRLRCTYTGDGAGGAQCL